jgi:hypothetical protein
LNVVGLSSPFSIIEQDHAASDAIVCVEHAQQMAIAIPSRFMVDKSAYFKKQRKGNLQLRAIRIIIQHPRSTGVGNHGKLTYHVTLTAAPP